MEAILWLMLFLAAYPFVVYPPVLQAIALLKGRPWKRQDIRPRVTMIISAHNEEAVIAEKIANSLGLSYPVDAIQIIVASDGSSDRTDDIVSSVPDPRVNLMSFPRLGKSGCLNEVVPLATGDILVFTDANATFPSDALLRIAENFADPAVGAVTGWTKYTDRSGGQARIGLHSSMERRLKHLESRVASCVGADGAIFAIRKHLFPVLRDDDLNDLVIPLHVVRTGKRVVMDSNVYCLEESSEGIRGEYRRQVRITARTVVALWRNLGHLNPLRFGFFSFFLLSRKVLRLTFPIFLLAALVINYYLAVSGSLLYALILWLQIYGIAVGFSGFVRSSKNRPFASAGATLLVAAGAQLVGVARAARGMREVTWTPRN